MWLAPSRNHLLNWKRMVASKTAEVQHYIQGYVDEVLGYLSPEEVYQKLADITNGEDCTLMCFEKSPNNPNFKITELNPIGEFCHRHIVSEFLRYGGFESKEKYD